MIFDEETVETEIGEISIVWETGAATYPVEIDSVEEIGNFKD